MSNESENYDIKRPVRGSHRTLPSTRSILGLIFGIFMFIVYEGMGILMFINFFQWDNSWGWTRWIVGAVLVIYGFFRGYRTYKDLTQKEE